MKYELELTHQYLRDLKLARKRGLDEEPIPIYSKHILIKNINLLTKLFRSVSRCHTP